MEDSQATLLSDACVASHVATVILVTCLGRDSIHLCSDTTGNPGRACQGRKGQASLRAFGARAVHSDVESELGNHGCSLKKSEQYKECNTIYQSSFPITLHEPPCTNQPYMYCTNRLSHARLNSQKSTGVNIKSREHFLPCPPICTPGIPTAIPDARVNHTLGKKYSQRSGSWIFL